MFVPLDILLCAGVARGVLEFSPPNQQRPSPTHRSCKRGWHSPSSWQATKTGVAMMRDMQMGIWLENAEGELKELS